MTAIMPTPDEIEHQIVTLLDQRRADCDCAPYRKPCTTCDAYWDGLVEMADRFPKAPDNGSTSEVAR